MKSFFNLYLLFFLKKYINRNNIELIHYDVSAFELIKVSYMSLSSPFTSPSVLLKNIVSKLLFIIGLANREK